MDSLSFTFLLFASYCMALVFLLPAVPRSHPHQLSLIFDAKVRTGWPSLVLASTFLMFIDVIIDPVALRGDRWFLGLIYGYPDPGLYFGIPLMNFVGWAVVGLIALSGYFLIDRRLPPRSTIPPVTRPVLFGCALYYGVLVFNLSVTFWIGEVLLGLIGVMIYVPVSTLFALRVLNRLPGPVISLPGSSAAPIAAWHQNVV